MTFEELYSQARLADLDREMQGMRYLAELRKGEPGAEIRQEDPRASLAIVRWLRRTAD